MGSQKLGENEHQSCTKQQQKQLKTRQARFMMENTSPEKAETDELHHAMDRAKNAPSSENIHHLIKKLQEKLDDHASSSGGGEGGHEDPDQHTQLFGVPSLHDQNEGDHGPHLPNLNSTSHLANSHDGHNELADTGKSLNTDTIVLVGSLIVMIFIGLIFHRIITYLAKIRSRRRQYQMGLKQLGEHMNTVTRTISNPPSAAATPVGTPSINMRKLAHLNSANNNNNNNIGSPNTSKKGNLIAVAALKASQQASKSSGGGGGIAPLHKASHLDHPHQRGHGPATIPDDDNSVFKPSTHVMRREDSALGTLATAAQLRHKEHLHVHHIHADED